MPNIHTTKTDPAQTYKMSCTQSTERDTQQEHVTWNDT